MPGPGIPLILLGLVILATEFAWAQRTLHHVRHRSSKVLSTIARRSTRKEPCP
ncbi:MAG: PGPGW domain-containing protein [Actinobacteria bacterium]|nr:PGPGW domain-containing protein [Actinomycetota bacterium]